MTSVHIDKALLGPWEVNWSPGAGGLSTGTRDGQGQEDGKHQPWEEWGGQDGSGYLQLHTGAPRAKCLGHSPHHVKEPDARRQMEGTVSTF